jgi:flavin reductase (DIM6/NTAB) family NADH-FMN oxidoreductase RutF
MDKLKFKDFMAGIPTCVAVVATLTEDKIQACTVSSLTSFDVNNPGLFVVLQNKSKTLVAIEHTGNFSASILTLEQKNLALHFSSKEKNSTRDTVAAFDFNGESSIPYLSSSLGVAFCKLEKTVALENTTILLGRVTQLISLENKSPLIYANRKYSSLINSST